MSQIDLVSACSNGGYHCEFAGGGLPLPNYTYQKFEELRQAQDLGTGITLNTLYANPYLWGFQYPIVCELRYVTRVARRCLAQLLQFCYHNRDFSTYHGNRSRSSFCVVGHCSKKGTPIESLTIGAGVPTAEKAVEICDGTCAICPCHSFAARSQASTASA